MTLNLTSLQQIGAWLKRRTNTTRPHPLVAPRPASCWIFNNGLYVEVLYDVVVQKFTIAISSPDEFLYGKVVSFWELHPQTPNEASFLDWTPLGDFRPQTPWNFAPPRSNSWLCHCSRRWTM